MLKFFLTDVHWLYLKVVDKERPHSTFMGRHPRLSFLSVALLLGTVTYSGIIGAAPIPFTNVVSHTAVAESNFSENAMAYLASADLQDDSKALRTLMSMFEVDKSDINAKMITVSRSLTNIATDASIETMHGVVINAEPAAIELQPILDIPFDAETQWRILDEVCDGNLRLFCLAMTMAQKESKFVPNLIGDHGLSYGYYQVKTDCHADRIAKFGFSKEDLFDPVKGAIVCVDYLRELLWVYQDGGEVNHLLFMMYNQGPGGARNSIAHMVYSTDYSCEAMDIYESYLAQAGLESGVPIER